MAVHRCGYCKEALEGNSTFCKHCGRKVKYPRVKKIKCPSCKERIDSVTSFCKHCGAHLKKFVHTHHLSRLLNLVIFLLIILILAIILSYPLYYYPSVPEEAGADVTIDTVTCTWEEDHYRICETVSWSGATVDYAKAYIPGGEALEASEAYTTPPFVYCQNIGVESGYKIARAMLFDAAGLIKDVGKGVSCEATSKEPDKPLKKTLYAYETKASFTAQRPLGRSLKANAEGSYVLQFPDVVRSCNIVGEWATDADIILRQRRYCHDAPGSFSGYADKDNQYVLNDPDFFTWAGLNKPRVNPPEMRHDGYALHMHTCDSRYYQKPRYYARATVAGFGTDTLTFNWEYFDDDTQPHVTFIFDMDCTLEGLQ